MNCPRCGADLVMIGRQLRERPHEPTPKDDTPAGVLASIRHHIAVARISKDPALLEVLDKLEQALAKLPK